MRLPKLLLLCSIYLIFLVVVSTAAPTISAAEKDEKWGNLSATFLYDGDPPVRRELKIDKDREAAKLPILDPSLIVDPKTKSIANVFVWLDVPTGEKPPAHHPDYDKQIDKPIKIEVRNLQIEPHAVGLWTKQPLQTASADPIGHHLGIATESPGNTTYQNIIPVDSFQTFRFKKSESRPIQMACEIHAWMNGYLLIQEHPYFAVSSSDGKLTIRNLPVGKHIIAVWHELPRFVTTAELDGKPVEWKRGRLTVDIKPGDNDLGEILIKPERRGK